MGKTTSEYETEAIEDLTIDITNLENYLLKLGLLRAKWSKYLYNEESILSVCEEKLNQLYKEKYHYYLYEYNEKIEKKSIDLYIKGDDAYNEAEKYSKLQKSKCKMVEQVISALDKQSFSVNSLIKYMMWQSGAQAQ